MELALLPLARAGLLSGVVHVTGITGSSGAGIAPGPTTHHPSRAGNLRTYKPLEHQHIPEVLQTLGDAGAKDVALQFVPVSAPMTRGILVTAFVTVAADLDERRVATMYDEQYAGHPFVRRPRKRFPEVVAVANSNHAEVGFQLGPVHGSTRTLAAFCATDNLIKGGAGQAIQNMNLVLGVDERASLEDVGPWP
jgi:LysW-gamma-L-alpha-aminoadipyl-6-phosphate/LysW-L-glutamyl-5-phosphate reductase